MLHQINTIKKPEFVNDLTEGLERTIQGHKKAYRFTYGAVIAMEKFRCQVRLLDYMHQDYLLWFLRNYS